MRATLGDLIPLNNSPFLTALVYAMLADFGIIVFRFFFCSVVWLPLCRRFGAKVGPKTLQGIQKGAKREPKSLSFGAQSVTFGGQLGESGPLRKHQYLLCFTHILQASAPAFSH